MAQSSVMFYSRYVGPLFQQGNVRHAYNFTVEWLQLGERSTMNIYNLALQNTVFVLVDGEIDGSTSDVPGDQWRIQVLLMGEPTIFFLGNCTSNTV